MSHKKYRTDNTCLNCNSQVIDKFCSSCGQENTETRQSFFSLVHHFIEDLTHYDSAFLKTIKYLMFFPGKLTAEYLNGKRMKYVAPIRLYFFISFITFLLPNILPEYENIDTQKQIVTVNKERLVKYKSIHELDSIQSTLQEDKKMSRIRYEIEKFKINSDNLTKNENLGDKATENMLHYVSKAVFFYLPIFGFILFLFHNKKKWVFFDHAIFTIHFFSFLLLLFTFTITIWSSISSYLIDNSFFYALDKIIGISTLFYIAIYFIIAHKKIYHETKFISTLKSILMIVINFILMIIFLIALAIYTINHTN